MTEELARLISDWISQKSNTLHLLSQQSGISYTTVKRIAQGETKAEFSNALKILTTVCDASTTNAFLAKHFPDVSALMRSVYVNHQTLSQSAYEFSTTELGFKIIFSACAKSGIDRATVAKNWGEDGLDLLEDILEAGILHEVNGRIKAINFKTTSAEAALKKIGLALANFSVKNLGDKKSLLSFHTDGFSNWGLEQIYEKTKEYVAAIESISSQPEAKGDNVAFVATLFNRLTKESQV